MGQPSCGPRGPVVLEKVLSSSVGFNKEKRVGLDLSKKKELGLLNGGLFSFGGILGQARLWEEGTRYGAKLSKQKLGP